VSNVRGDSGGLTRSSTASGESFRTRSVIVATGANQQPYITGDSPPLSAPRIVQIHSSQYRRPSQLPIGTVMVVGAGNSGAQIALELADPAGGSCCPAATPARCRVASWEGTMYDWLWPTLMRPSIDTALGRRLMQGRLFAGDPLVGMSAKKLRHDNLRRVGRTIGVRDGLPVVEGGEVDTRRRRGGLVHRIPAGFQLDRVADFRARRISGSSARDRAGRFRDRVRRVAIISIASGRRCWAGVGEDADSWRRHCGTMPAARITFAYESISSRTNFANCSGDISMTSLPRPESFWRISGLASALRTSAEILETTSDGVAAGAHTPNHSGESASETPASPVVGHVGQPGCCASAC
jgi:hypothetical protein